MSKRYDQRRPDQSWYPSRDCDRRDDCGAPLFAMETMATLRENGLKLVTDNRHRLWHAGTQAFTTHVATSTPFLTSSVGTHWRGSMPTRLPWQPWPCNAYMLVACLLRYKRSRMRSVQSAVSYLYVCGYIDAMFCLQLFELRVTPEVLGVMELLLKPG